MEDMGDYQVLAHIETPEFSMRLLRLGENAYVAPHYHDESKQLYAVLEGVVEITHGDRTLRLCPYETTHIERQTVHDVRPVGGRALVVSICTPPLKLDDQHPIEGSDAYIFGRSASALPGYLQPVGQR
jgi:mannose-6-phosphate isomerase-like protein (cupin superfamily)